MASTPDKPRSAPAAITAGMLLRLTRGIASDGHTGRAVYGVIYT